MLKLISNEPEPIVEGESINERQVDLKEDSVDWKIQERVEVELAEEDIII
jgi:hypothetical protein